MTPEERTAKNVAKFEQAIDKPRAGYYPEQLKTLVGRPAMEVELMEMSEIVVENRHRKDLGDIQSLGRFHSRRWLATPTRCFLGQPPYCGTTPIGGLQNPGLATSPDSPPRP